MRLTEQNPVGTRAANLPGAGLPESPQIGGQPSKIIQLAPLLAAEMPAAGTNIAAGVLNARLVTIQVVTAGTEYSAPHGLGRIPVGMILVDAPHGNGSVNGTAIKRGSTAWNNSTIYIKSTANATCNLTLLVF